MDASNHQAGISDPPPEHALVVALNFGQRDPATAGATLRALKELVRRELAADIDEINPQTDPALATSETGELGVTPGYDTAGLTITLGLSTTGYAALGLSSSPADLHPINWTGFGEAPLNPNEGDIVLQVCSDSAYVTEHVLRRVEHSMIGRLAVVYALAGEQRNGGNHGDPLTADSARALIGFHDGLSNLDPGLPEDEALIFIDSSANVPMPATPSAGPQVAPGLGQLGYGPPSSPQPIFPPGLPPAPGPEPTWATGGSYLTVRASVLDLARWDSRPLQAQQQDVGRFKFSGATLDNPDLPAHRRDEPVFATTPANGQVPPTSHIRRANPRALPTDAQRRIFRRGYPLLLTSAEGTMQRGLLFLAYARTISTQFEFMMMAWLKNQDFPSPGAGIDPLLAFESQVLAGGNYFVPPVSDPGKPWDWVLPNPS